MVCGWSAPSQHDVPKSSSTLRLSVPHFPLPGCPTNFGKRISGEDFNVYHWLHIRHFDDIVKRVSSPIFESYAEKWRSYADDWPEQSWFKGKDIKAIDPAARCSQAVGRTLSDYLDRSSRANNRGRSGCKLTPLGQYRYSVSFSWIVIKAGR